MRPGMVAALVLLGGLISHAEAQADRAPRAMPTSSTARQSYPELLPILQSQTNEAFLKPVAATPSRQSRLEAPPSAPHAQAAEVDAHAEPLFPENVAEVDRPGSTWGPSRFAEPVPAPPAFLPENDIPATPPIVHTASLPEIPSQPPVVSNAIVPASWDAPPVPVQRNLEQKKPLLTASPPPTLAPVIAEPRPGSPVKRPRSNQRYPVQPASSEWILPEQSWSTHTTQEPIPAPPSASVSAPPAIRVSAPPGNLIPGAPSETYINPPDESFSAESSESFSFSPAGTNNELGADQFLSDEMACDEIGCDGMACNSEGCGQCYTNFYRGDPLCPLPNPQGQFLPFGVLGVIPGNHRTIGLADLFIPLTQSESSLLFGDFRGDWDNQGAGGGAGYFGLGYRTFIDPMWIFGGYAYGDLLASRSGNFFGQANLGVELLSLNWDLRVNGYVPGTAAQNAPYQNGYSDGIIITRNFRERAYGGADFEVGYRCLHWGWNDRFEVRNFIGGYAFGNTGTGTTSFGGIRGRIELRIYDICGLGNQSRLEFGLESAYDHVRNEQFFGFARIRIPFGKGGCRDMLDPLRRRMVDMPVRPLN